MGYDYESKPLSDAGRKKPATLLKAPPQSVAHNRLAVFFADGKTETRSAAALCGDDGKIFVARADAVFVDVLILIIFLSLSIFGTVGTSAANLFTQKHSRVASGLYFHELYIDASCVKRTACGDPCFFFLQELCGRRWTSFSF